MSLLAGELRKQTEAALDNKELVAEVTPDQSGQSNQPASEQREESGFRNDRGSYDRRCCKRIGSQDQDQ